MSQFAISGPYTALVEPRRSLLFTVKTRMSRVRMSTPSRSAVVAAAHLLGSIQLLILVPVFFALMKERALRMELDNRWNQNEARSKRVWFSFSRAFAWQFKIKE